MVYFCQQSISNIFKVILCQTQSIELYYQLQAYCKSQLFDIFLYSNQICMSEQAPPQPQASTTPTQEIKQQPTSNNPPQQSTEQKRQPYTGYKLYERTQIETNKGLRDRRARAILSKEISLALFGRRRFKRIELICTLNNFYATLQIASLFHRRVAGLYMIVELEIVQYIQFADSKDTEGQAKQHSVFRITLTRYPTEKDRSSAGFHEAHKAEQITNPIEGLIQRKQRKKNFNKKDRKGKNQDKGQREQRERKDRQPRQNRPQPKQRREKQHYHKEERRDNRNQNRDRQDRQDRQEKQRKAKREKDEYQDRTHRRHYRDREDDRYPRESYQSQRVREDDRRDRTRNEKNYVEKRDQSRYVQKRQGDEGKYRRGQTRTRGTARVATHNYDPEHLRNTRKQNQYNESRRNQERGPRNPRRNRYNDDEDY